MELRTKNGLKVLTLNQYGTDWARMAIDGGNDEINIDTGDSTVFEDFIIYLKEESDLSEESIKYLEEHFFDDNNNAFEVEEGAREELENAGYEEIDEYFFKKIS